MNDPDVAQVRLMILKSVVFGGLNYFRSLLFGPVLPLVLVGILVLLWSIS